MPNAIHGRTSERGSTHFTVERPSVGCTTVLTANRTVTDPITALVHKLLTAEDPDELRILREQLNSAIRERLEELRKKVRALARLAKPRFLRN